MFSVRSSLFLAALTLCVLWFAPSPSSAQTPAPDLQAIASAKTAYFRDDSGSDAVGKRAAAELGKWGRFWAAHDPKNADLTIFLTTDPHEGGNLMISGGTGSVDAQGHVKEDSIPTFNKLEPVRTAFLIVIDVHSGKTVWTASHRWGGLLTGFNSVGEELVKKFEKQTALADQSTQLKLVKSTNPVWPADKSNAQVAGAVHVRIVVDRSGKVTSAKALSGPPDLFQSCVFAARHWQFAPPQHAPVTAEFEIK